MYISVDGAVEHAAVSWSIDEAGVLDLHSVNGVVICSIKEWNRCDRVLGDGETWETYRPQITVTNDEARAGAENVLDTPKFG